MIVWATTSPQIRHRQLKKRPLRPKNSSWIIIPLHRSHFTLSSPKLSLWDHGDWNKVNAIFYWKRGYIPRLSCRWNIFIHPNPLWRWDRSNLIWLYIVLKATFILLFTSYLFYYNLLSFLGPSDVFKNHWEPWERSCRACLEGKGRNSSVIIFCRSSHLISPVILNFQDCLKANISRCYSHPLSPLFLPEILFLHFCPPYNLSNSNW